VSFLVRQFHSVFVRGFSGTDLGGPLASAEVSAISDAIDQHAVPIFRGQTSTTSGNFTSRDVASTLDQVESVDQNQWRLDGKDS
jgi:alpha-ketoglutarate-dependent taurine dioxygenase